MLLSTYRKNYEQMASYIKDWDKLSKSDLCYNYLKYKENDNFLADCYLSGLISKYLKKMEIEYNKQQIKIISEEDYYNMVIESILYVLDKKIWDNSNSSLYKDSSAPEIAINTNLKSNIINFYIYLQRDKRKLNSGILSLDLLEENSSDGYYAQCTDEDVSTKIYLEKLIKQQFDDKEYIGAFTLDIMLNNNVFTDRKDEVVFSNSKLKHFIKEMDYDYCVRFSEKYKISLKDVLGSLKYIKNIGPSNLDKYIQKLFKILRKDKELSLFLHNAY